jgi:hypothetical protein
MLNIVNIVKMLLIKSILILTTKITQKLRQNTFLMVYIVKNKISDLHLFWLPLNKIPT